MTVEAIAHLLRCPRCAAAVRLAADCACTNPDCAYAADGFPMAAGKPVLIDFADSILDADGIRRSGGASTLERQGSFLRRLRERATGGNEESAENCQAFLAEIRKVANPIVLVVGGGARGDGTEALYAAADVRVIGVDIYASPDVELLADGHRLPFADASFDGVWIQAVLEHVVAPERVVVEIHRVLKDRGLVYAETPFLQPVHERAYDFTRFTRSGHRWLFRRFDEARSGTIGGPGESLVWAIRYLARALFRSDKAGSAAALAFFWLRWLDRFVDAPHRADAATGVFFLGRKSAGDAPLRPRDLVAYFPGVRGR